MWVRRRRTLQRVKYEGAVGIGSTGGGAFEGCFRNWEALFGVCGDGGSLIYELASRSRRARVVLWKQLP